ncbi:MAG: acyl-homoserine-lactone synthase [Pseudomonadota bacterium]
MTVAIEVERVCTAAQRADHHRLRYQVYCLDRGFEPQECAADGEEHDAFDAHSVHFVAYDSTRQAVGALRLVFPVAGFPAAHVTRVDEQALAPLAGKVVELSRLCLRHPDGHATGELFQGSDVMLAMLHAAWRYCRNEGISHWLCLITPALERMLGRLQVPFEAVGDSCRYRGQRRPLLTDINQMMRAAMRSCHRVERLLQREPQPVREALAAH